MEDNYYYYNSSESTSEANTLSSFPAGGVLFFTVTVMFVCILTWQSVCKFCKVYCNSRCCSCCKWEDRDDQQQGDGQDEHPDEDRDRVIAMELQRQLNEEASEENRMAKRKERRMWYEYYLRPWTMTVTKSDLINPHDDTDSSTESETDEDRTTSVQTGSQDSSEESSDEKHDEVGDLEYGESPEVCLRLPASTGGRCVDGTCALCLDDYCPGDQVVWSSCVNCQHAFHKECFLLWLSKGKKRCPVCRHWFVPGQKIDDQKILHGKAWTDALAEMVQAEKEETERAAAAEAEAAAAALSQGQQELQQLRQNRSEDEEAAAATNQPQHEAAAATNQPQHEAAAAAANGDPEGSSKSTNIDSRPLKLTNSTWTCISESGDSDYFYDCNDNVNDHDSSP